MTPRPCLFAVDPTGTGHVDTHAGAFEAAESRIEINTYVRLIRVADRGWEAGGVIGPTANTLIIALGLHDIDAVEDG